MARETKSEKSDLEYREKPISSPPPPPPEPEPQVEEPAEVVDEPEDEPVDDGTLTPEQREQKRLARKPNIDHLPNATVVLDDNSILPLFDAGDRIIAERHVSFLWGHPWLDTRVYTVKSINDEKGEVHCIDDELQHYACIGYKHPFTRIKLCPKKGNPFTVPKVKNAGAGLPDATGKPKRRGRPKGSKNRPKEVIKLERQAKKEGK